MPRPEGWRACRFIQMKNNNVSPFWHSPRFTGNQTVGYRPAANKATASGDSGYGLDLKTVQQTYIFRRMHLIAPRARTENTLCFEFPGEIQRELIILIKTAQHQKHECQFTRWCRELARNGSRRKAASKASAFDALVN